MTIRPRAGFYTCTSCEQGCTEAMAYTIGAVTFSLCVKCAKRLGVLNIRALRATKTEERCLKHIR